MQMLKSYADMRSLSHTHTQLTIPFKKKRGAGPLSLSLIPRVYNPAFFPKESQ